MKATAKKISKFHCICINQKLLMAKFATLSIQKIFFNKLYLFTFSERQWHLEQPWLLHPTPGEGRRLCGQSKDRLPEQAFRGTSAQRLAEAQVSGQGGQPQHLPRRRGQGAHAGQSAHMSDQVGAGGEECIRCRVFQ